MRVKHPTRRTFLTTASMTSLSLASLRLSWGSSRFPLLRPLLLQLLTSSWWWGNRWEETESGKTFLVLLSLVSLFCLKFCRRWRNVFRHDDWRLRDQIKQLRLRVSLSCLSSRINTGLHEDWKETMMMVRRTNEWSDDGQGMRQRNCSRNEPAGDSSPDESFWIEWKWRRSPSGERILKMIWMEKRHEEEQGPGEERGKDNRRE